MSATLPDAEWMRDTLALRRAEAVLLFGVCLRFHGDAAADSHERRMWTAGCAIIESVLAAWKAEAEAA